MQPPVGSAPAGLSQASRARDAFVTCGCQSERMTAHRKVLVVEDDRDIAHLVSMHLKDVGCEVGVAHDGETGLELALDGEYDLVVLDLMLPGLDGLEVCRTIRSAHEYTLILMLTAKSSELDRVVGLEMGADDYLVKPFSLRELQARVKALLRRKRELAREGSTHDAEEIRIGALIVDVARRRVQVSGRELHLTAREFDLLLQFARHPGRAYTRRELLDLVWGYGFDGYEHTVNSHINRLRAKLEEDQAHPRYVQTVWGVGYRFTDEDP